MTFKRLLAALLAALSAFSCQPAYANTTTAVLGLNKPGVGADADLWGAYLNTNEDTLDALFSAGPVLLLTKGGSGASTAAGARTAFGVVIGTNVQAWSAQLDSAAALASNGLVARTAANTFTARTLTGTAAEITVANGDGVAGAPTLSLPAALTFTGKTVTGGTFTGLTSLANNGDSTLGDANADTTTVNGHVVVAGTAPVISLCGTSPTVSPGESANDTRGAIRNGSGGAVTTCTITFSRAFASAPICVVAMNGSASTSIGVSSETTTALVVQFSASYNGSWNYLCAG